MNDLQKKLLIVGIVVFMVWFLIGMDLLLYGIALYGSDNSRIISYFITNSWYQVVLFIIWLGSLIAFKVYKD